MAVVVVTRLNRSAWGGSTFGQVFSAVMSDGSALPATLALSVANNDALTGFEPDAAHGGCSPGFVPVGTQVRVTPYTTSAAHTPGNASAIVDKASYIKDTDDPSNTSMKLTVYQTAANVFELIIECLQ